MHDGPETGVRSFGLSLTRQVAGGFQYIERDSSSGQTNVTVTDATMANVISSIALETLDASTPTTQFSGVYTSNGTVVGKMRGAQSVVIGMAEWSLSTGSIQRHIHYDVEPTDLEWLPNEWICGYTAYGSILGRQPTCLLPGMNKFIIGSDMPEPTDEETTEYPGRRMYTSLHGDSDRVLGSVNNYVFGEEPNLISFVKQSPSPSPTPSASPTPSVSPSTSPTPSVSPSASPSPSTTPSASSKESSAPLPCHASRLPTPPS